MASKFIACLHSDIYTHANRVATHVLIRNQIVVVIHHFGRCRKYLTYTTATVLLLLHPTTSGTTFREVCTSLCLVHSLLVSNSIVAVFIGVPAPNPRYLVPKLWLELRARDDELGAARHQRRLLAESVVKMSILIYFNLKEIVIGMI